MLHEEHPHLGLRILTWRAGTSATLGEHQLLLELDMSYATLLAFISADVVDERPP